MRSSVANPLLPSGFDVLWSLVVVLAAGLTLTALVQAFRARELSGAVAAVWVLVIILVPVLGALAWLVARPDRRMVSTR